MAEACVYGGFPPAAFELDPVDRLCVAGEMILVLHEKAEAEEANATEARLEAKLAKMESAQATEVAAAKTTADVIVSGRR